MWRNLTAPTLRNLEIEAVRMLALQREARLAFCQWRGILHDLRSGTSAGRKIQIRCSPFRTKRLIVLHVQKAAMRTADTD
jgi:hypothetical protein